MKNGIGYPDLIRQGFPGWEPMGAKEVYAKRDSEKEAAVKYAEKVQHLEKAGKQNTPEMLEALDNFEKHRAEYERLEKGLFSGDAFADQSIENMDYTPDEFEFSLGDLVGRSRIGKNRSREPMDRYTDNASAEIVEEGQDSTPKNLTDGMTMILSDAEDRIHFDDTVLTPINVYTDDPETIRKAFKSAHKRHFIVAENTKAISILTGCKDPVAMSAANLQNTANEYLTGRAKRNAFILVGKSGFAKLDMDDATGSPLVTKDDEGFIYKSKYRVIELPDDMFPENNGDMCIVGDLKHVLRFFIVREMYMFRDDIFPYLCGSKVNRTEIIALSTESNEAYIYGYLE